MSAAHGVCSAEWTMLANRRCEILVRTDFKTKLCARGAILHEPCSISFICRRKVACIDGDIFDIFKNAVIGKAHENMQANPAGCPHGAVTGGCGNKRGELEECRCPTLDRMQKPHIRYQYENTVINRILNILQAQNIKNFKLNLAMFCSGRLLGEEILLFRLFNHLRHIDAHGRISLFLVDGCYESSIQATSLYHANLKRNLPVQFIDAVGGNGSLAQFLIEISKCVPPTISFEGTVFDHSDKYIERAEQDATFRHHLVIGADIEDARSPMTEISRRAAMSTEEPIALVKFSETEPGVCVLDIDTGKDVCFNPDDCASPGGKLELQPSRGGCQIL